MIWLLLALVVPQESSFEPQTRAELDAVSARYTAARFAVSFDANNRLACKPDDQFGSTTLSIQSCIMAAKCAEKGERSPDKLARCIDRTKSALLKSYRRDWLKAHSQ